MIIILFFLLYLAAVMIEAGWQDMLDTLVVVITDKEIARHRLMLRNGLSEEDADKRISSQMSNEERISFASFVIYNKGSFDDLRSEAEELWIRMHNL